MLKSKAFEAPTTLTIQHELPKIPTLSSLPSIPSFLLDGEYGCPKLVYCLWKSGRHAAMRIHCQSWTCIRCSREKLFQMSQFLADATVDVPIIFEITVALDDLSKVNKCIRKRKISSLNIKLIDNAYLLMSDMANGRGWEANAISRAAAIAKIHDFDTRIIRRRDFTFEWKPEKLYKPKGDTVIYSTVFASQEDLQEVLSKYGLDIKKDYIDGDPLDVMERIVKVRADQTISFDNQDYVV